jgi:L-threonylcarbamoyladenylate synthase
VKIISENNPNVINLACEALKNGEVIAFATDTVYGIACDAANRNAVKKLYDIKKRDEKKPIAIFVKNLAIAEEIFLFDELSKKIAQNFLPGSITLVLQKKIDSSIKLADNLNPQDNSLGFRIVDRKFIAELMSNFAGVLAVSSANLSNQNPALTAKDVEKYFLNSTLKLIVDGNCKKNAEVSTVIKVANKKIEILRFGAIKQKSIDLILNSWP